MNRTGSVILLCIMLVAITLAVYMQAGNHQFLSFDDEAYIIKNPHIVSGLTGNNILWAFTSVESGNWQPLTWLSHMTDAQLFGLNPRGHHLTSVALHVVSTLLLFLMLLRLTGAAWRSSLVAALFALHPLHVESVAWVVERKDVLSALFWFLTLLLYAGYATKQKPALYLLTFLSFVLGLMSKPMLITLPIILLLLDIWPLGRYQYDKSLPIHERLSVILPFVKEKIPFFICSLASGIITIYGQGKGGAIASLEAASFPLRCGNALVAYATYIGKTIWPHNLAILYPFPPFIPFWQVFISFILLFFISIIALQAAKHSPYMITGWFWFLITLLPVIGLIQVGNQSMADRYTYIPLTGLFIMVVWGCADLTRNLQHRQSVRILLTSAVILSSAVTTWRQLGYWRDSITMYTHTLQVTSNNHVIHYNLGSALQAKGELTAAMLEFQKAIQIYPGYSNAHYNLGVILQSTGNRTAAIGEYREAIRINPDGPNADAMHSNLGLALAGAGHLKAAMQEYQKALQLNPDNANAHYNLGLAYVTSGDMDAATMQFQETLRITPNDMDVRNALAAAISIQKRH